MNQAAAEGDDETELRTIEPPYGTLEWIQYWSEFEGHLPTPINLSITGSLVYKCSELRWFNFEVYPHKVKLTNTGYTRRCVMLRNVARHFGTLTVDIFPRPGAANGVVPKKDMGSILDILENKGRQYETDVLYFQGSPECFDLKNVVISAKWRTERPYLEGGPFFEKHVLSQIHFHWGSDMMEGSDHTVDERRYPGEMQVTFFRSEYLTQEEAIKHPDGVTMFCYLIKYGVNPDERLAWVIEGFPRVREAQTHTRIGPYPMSHLIPMFYEDYFLYWGKLETVKGEQFVIKWVVPRVVLFASYDQMKQFRKLWDPWDQPNLRNYRPLQACEDRHVFFINPHWAQYSSLLPIPRIPEPSISMLSPAYLKNPWMLPAQNQTEEDTAVQKTQTKTGSDTRADSYNPEARVSAAT